MAKLELHRTTKPTTFTIPAGRELFVRENVAVLFLSGRDVDGLVPELRETTADELAASDAGQEVADAD